MKEKEIKELMKTTYRNAFQEYTESTTFVSIRVPVIKGAKERKEREEKTT